MDRHAIGFVVLLVLALAGCGPGNDNPTWVPPLDDTSPWGQCTPDCFFKQCGDDGCRGICGTCSAGMVCSHHQCVLPHQVPDAGGDALPTDYGSLPDLGPDLLQASGLDEDGDQVDDAFDNCPTVFNPNQLDLDKDYLGDACDPDKDGDKYINDLDCNPTDPTVNPGAPELCNTGVDENCNGAVDEENASDCTDYYIDADGDGAGVSGQKRCLCQPEPPHTVKLAGDCNDQDHGFGPLVPEICDNLDNNCNLLVDEGCDDDGDGFCDADMFVWGDPFVCPNGPGDCYDYSANVYPGAVEIDGDDVDNDCDGVKAGEPMSSIDCECSNSCVGETTQDFLCAMDMCCSSLVLNQWADSPTGDTITGAWGAITQYGSASNDLAPFTGATYAVMGSGLYANNYHQSGDQLPGAGSQQDPYAKDSYTTMFDAVEVHFTMKAPPGATGFSIDYIFMSAEYEEYIGTQYNDKFYMVLTAPQTTGNQATVINYAPCSNPSVYYDTIDGTGQKVCYIAINTAFSEPCIAWTTDISGTGHECPTGSSTGWLTTSWPIQGDETFTLTFHVHDTSDQVLDSTVLIDNFRWEGGEFSQGTFSHN